MKDGFIKAAVVTPELKVADTEFNTDKIIEAIHTASNEGAKLLVFPELCLTGYTCSDLFWQDTLLLGAQEGLERIRLASEGVDAIIFVGLPMVIKGKLYNVAAAVSGGRILGLVPKTHLPNYSEFYEKRHFTRAPKKGEFLTIKGEKVPFGTRLLFQCKQMPALTIAAEICEDLWAPDPPSTEHARAGAVLIVNLSASDEVIGKAAYRRDLVRGQSGRLLCGYLYASSGEGESTTDLVFGGHDLIAENGSLLAESKRFCNGIIYADLDIHRLAFERRRITTFEPLSEEESYEIREFSLKWEETKLNRSFAKHPFVPSQLADRNSRCEDILSIQTMGLKKRLVHKKKKKAVIGISGGLDSTLALLVTVRAFDACGLDKKGILSVTMPCFGTTDRTYQNAVKLSEKLGVTLLEIPIRDAVNQHFKDIGQEETNLDVTYENAQARERTQVLMDLANKENGLVIGTGDLSELALGWATYNGDHMSMYGVNASVPKTLVRHLVRYYADVCGKEELKHLLLDVLDTPVSPELLPPSEGEINQKTEDIVGPYELHDFFLYYMLRLGFPPKKIFRIALQTFEGDYSGEEILKWEKNFYRRFFAQQFKRSCLPDGPKVGTVAVSPRGDLRMPSDASYKIWKNELDEM